MCRLFGFHSLVQSQVHQSLLHAENALLRQSEKHPDGWGPAYYQAGVPHIIKAENTACHDDLYHRVSAMVTSRTVLAHIRKATAGKLSFVNTHPFQYGHWVFAHNGKIGNLDALRPLLLARIAPDLRASILGDTDSECIFYLILTQLARRMDLHRRDAQLSVIAEAVQSAVQEICELTGGMNQIDHQDKDSTFLTFILTDGLHMLAHQGGKELHYSTYKRQCSRKMDCPHLSLVCENPSADGRVNHLVLASEPLQGENVWQPLGFGALLGVDADMRVHHFLTRAPGYQLKPTTKSLRMEVGGLALSNFRVDPLIYRGEVYDAFNSFTHDIPFYRKWCLKAGGPVLELCCGTGRITIPLAKAGIPITGLDFTESMLTHARQKAAADSLELDWVLGDMRDFRLDQKFEMIFIPFNSLQNTYSIEDVERTFASIKQHLRPRGYFLFSVFNPSLAFIVDRSREPHTYQVKLPDGRDLSITESCVYDSEHQVNQFTWLHRFSSGEPELSQRIDMRCFYPQEMDALLRYNGWRVIHKFGNFDEEKFQASSPHQIYVCQIARGR